MLKRREECNTYLTQVFQKSPQWRELGENIKYKVELSANIVAFISCRSRLLLLFSIRSLNLFLRGALTELFNKFLQVMCITNCLHMKEREHYKEIMHNSLQLHDHFIFEIMQMPLHDATSITYVVSLGTGLINFLIRQKVNFCEHEKDKKNKKHVTSSVSVTAYMKHCIYGSLFANMQLILPSSKCYFPN